MILDKLLQFTGVGVTAPSNSDGLNDTITTALTNGPSSGTVDIGIGLQQTANPSGSGLPGLGTAMGARDLGIGDDPAIKCLVQVVAVPGTLGGTSVNVALWAAPDTGAGAPGSFYLLAQGPTVTSASGNLVVGARLLEFDIPRPSVGNPLPRYLQLQYTSVGTFNAGLLLRGDLVVDRFDQITSSAAGLPLSGYPAGVVINN